MKSISCALLIILPPAFLAEPVPPAHPDLPRDIALQEQAILITAKMKNIAEMQDLIIQQQQLLLQHLDALRRDVAQLQRERTNAATRSELQTCLEKLNSLQSRLDHAQLATEESVRKLVQSMVAQPAESSPPAADRSHSAPKLQPYRVQPGDTLLRILARVNEALEKDHLPRVTQEQIELANPGLTPDKIRVGQTLYLPLPEKPRP